MSTSQTIFKQRGSTCTCSFETYLWEQTDLEPRRPAMPKTRKRKHPIVQTSTASIAAQSCRTTIRQYHLLLKRRRQLELTNETIALAEIDQQISSIGGLERYQQMSSLGQQGDRGGGSEKVFIQWMKGIRKTQSDPKNIR